MKTSTAYELRYEALSQDGQGYAFPCDARGQVDLDRLSDRARTDYLFARAMVGRQLAQPRLQPACRH